MSENVTLYKPKTAVELRREMAGKPEVLAALDPVERAVFISSTAKTFTEYDGAELARDLDRALQYIFKDTGLRNPDAKEVSYLVVRLCEILKRHYGGLTLKDFRMAFEMSITGELDDYLPKGRDGQADRGHYQQFNAEYVCKILNAYKARRGFVMKKANDAAPARPEPVPGPAELKVYRDNTRRVCLDAFLEFKYRGRMPKLSPISEMLCYGLLASVGLADEIEVTPDEQREIWQRTINEYARTERIGKVNQLKREGIGAPELENGAFKLARRKALMRTFAWMVREEIQLTDYIK